jgi:uncharacterized membrane protein YebE (DUF533 family)
MREADRAVVKSLVSVCWADGEINDEERQMLGGILAQMGFDHKDLLEIGEMMKEKPAPGDIARQIPDPGTRREVMQLVLALALADHGVGTLERRFLKTIASELEIGDKELKELQKETEALLKAQKEG